VSRLLTILCPVFNEESVIPLFFDRMRPVLVKLSERYSVDLVFLNDASTDRTLQEIEKVRQSWPSTYVITTSRKVGYCALQECGIRHARGDLIVFNDVDCEDPPEMILEFAEKHEQGFDIVYGERVDREEPAWLNSARKFFYRILHALADDEIILDMAEFAMFTAEVRDAILRDSSSFPFIRASIGRVGFRRAAIPFKRRKRIAGRSHYNLIGMSIFAIAGILASSTLFLRLPIYLLPLVLLAIAGSGIAYIQTHAPGWALAGILVFASYVGATLAFTALYVARTYKNGLQRPTAIIDHRLSILQPPPEPTAGSAPLHGSPPRSSVLHDS